MISTEQELIDYCLRRLGFPVISINVDDDQITDRVQDTLDIYRLYHYDGTLKVYLKIQVVAADVINGYLDVPTTVTFISRALSVGGVGGLPSPAGAGTVFDILAQPFVGAGGTGGQTVHPSLDQQAGLGSGGVDILGYYLNQQYAAMVTDLFGRDNTPIRYNSNMDRVYVDRTMVEGQFMVFECYQIIDPVLYNKLWNDWFFKKHVTSGIKQQWGQNLSKMNGIQLLGGASINADKIFDQATQELDKIEETMAMRFEIPAMGHTA